MNSIRWEDIDWSLAYIAVLCLVVLFFLIRRYRQI